MQKKQDQYFKELISDLNNKQSNGSKGRILADLVLKKMEEKIMISEVKLPEQPSKKKLKVQKKAEEGSEQNQEHLLRKVENQKQALLKKIKQLQFQQSDLKTKIKLSTSRQKPYRKGDLTEEDKNLLKSFIKSHRNFQKSIEKKDKQLALFYQQQTKEQAKFIQSLFDQRKQKRRSQILENLKELEINSHKRKQFLQDADRKIKQMRETEYLYQKNYMEEKERKAQQEKQYNKKLQELRRHLKLDVQSIREHQRKYQEYLKENHFRFEQKMIENKKKMRSKSYAGNYYQAVIKEQIEEQKRSQYENFQKKLAFKQRICKFQEKLNSSYKPKISNQSKFKPTIHTISLRSLSTAEQRQRGLQYLTLAKKIKDLNKQKERKKALTPNIQKRQFIDYTKQFKYKTKQDAQSKFNQILKQKKSINDYQSINKVLELANEIEAKSKLPTDKKLLNSVKYKIELLNALE